MPQFKTKYSRFTAEEYVCRKARGLFWALPPSLTDQDNPLRLAVLHKQGGAGVTSALPVLAMYARSSGDRRWALSRELIARLSGISPSTFNRAVLERLNVVEFGNGLRGLRVTTVRRLSPALYVNLKEAPFVPASHYFYFPSTLLDGGHWAMMSPSQRLLFLALATRAVVYSAPPANLSWLIDIPANEPDRVADLEAAFRHGCRGEPMLRLAQASITELACMTGLALSSVQVAINAFRDRSIWTKNANTIPLATTYAPLWVYPPAQRGESLVFCFRDHVEPWPFDVLNGCADRRDFVQCDSTSAEADIGLPF